MAADPEAGHRIIVQNLSRTPVTEYKHKDGSHGINEEDQVGYFFYDLECAVMGVTLMVDHRNNKCRGFGYVQMADEASVEKALKMNGAMVPHLTREGLPLVVERAKPADNQKKTREREVSRLTEENDSMERDLRLREARVTDLTLQLHKHRQRQREYARQRNEAILEAELEREKARRSEILDASNQMLKAEEQLLEAFRIEEGETQRMKDLVSDVDVGLTGAGTSTEVDSGAVASEASAEASTREVSERGTPSGEVQPMSAQGSQGAEKAEWPSFIPVRNTFVHYNMPPMEKLSRTITAPATMKRIISKDRSSVATPLPVVEGQDTGAEGAAPAVWEEAPPATTAPPWRIDRSVSSRSTSQPDDVNREVSRELLEKKLSASSPTSGETSGPADAAASISPAASPQGAAASTSRTYLRREVRLKKVPEMSPDQFREEFGKELARLWRSARGGRAPPQLVSTRKEDKATLQRVTSSYAAVAAHMGMDLIVTFADPDDALWFVEGRQAAWSKAEQVLLRGAIVEVEWAKPELDYRRLQYEAGTDASSQISYDSKGTRQSRSSAIAGKALKAGSVPAKRTSDIPPRNRSVVLDGFDCQWSIQQVRNETLKLLQRLWKEDGLEFDPKVRLHHGEGDGGILVKPASPSKAQVGHRNAGHCIVKLKRHLDARFLAESLPDGSLTVGEGADQIQLKAMWARPRAD